MAASPPQDPHFSTPFALADAARRKVHRRRRHQSASSAGLARQAHKERRLSPAQQQGLEAEARAVQWLQARGLVLLKTNLRCPYGELDAVFRADARTMVIVEIRQRCTGTHGGAAASITPAKQQRLRRAAAWHLPALAMLGFAGRTPHCRFDAVCIDGDSLDWLQAIF